MAWRSHGHARVNPDSPRAFARCDRCGFLTNLESTSYQHEWRGTTLQNTRRRVCRICLDKPFIFYRAIVLSPDPVPVSDPRIELLAEEMGPPPRPWSPYLGYLDIQVTDESGGWLRDESGGIIDLGDVEGPPLPTHLFDEDTGITLTDESSGDILSPEATAAPVNPQEVTDDSGDIITDDGGNIITP